MALLIHYLGDRSGRVVISTTRTVFPRERRAVRIAQKVGWISGPVWTVMENIVHTGIRTQNNPARSKSPYRQLYAVRHIST